MKKKKSKTLETVTSPPSSKSSELAACVGDTSEATSKIHAPNTDVVEQPESPVNTGGTLSDSTLPKWYHPLLRKKWKKARINKLMNDFCHEIKHPLFNYTPDKKDAAEYLKMLKTLKYKNLNCIDETFEKQIPYNLIDKLKKINKRFSSLVSIIQDNQTIDTFVVSNKARLFNRKGFQYMCNSNFGNTNVKAGMRQYFYYQNNPYPIIFKKNEVPQGTPDGLFLKQTTKFEALTALANAVKLKRQNDIILIVSIISCLLLVVLIFICLKGFNMIK